MRIGTWNLNNAWGLPHADLLRDQRCDVWLLTEVRPTAIDSGLIADYHAHLSSAVMSGGQHWAAVLSLKPFEKLDDPHPASAAVRLEGLTYCSTVLPWRSGLAEYPAVGDRHGDKTGNAIQSLLEMLPKSALVWGGDWNHSLIGPEATGSDVGRAHVLSLIEALNLQVPTAGLRHQRGKRSVLCPAIDHVAVPVQWDVLRTARIPADGLSDHDAYVIDVQPN